MSTELWQLSLVVAGGFIGLFGGLFSTLLNAFLAERKARRERLERFHELLGKRHAIQGEPNEKESTTAMFREWLKESKPDSARVAFMSGLLEKNAAQIEGYMAEAETARRGSEIARREGEALQRKVAALTEEKRRLTTEYEVLQQELVRLDQIHNVRGFGSKISGDGVD